MTRRDYDIPPLYRVLKKSEPLLRLWIPSLFKWRWERGLRIQSSWEQLLLRVSSEERKRWDRDAETALRKAFEGCDLSKLVAGQITADAITVAPVAGGYNHSLTPTQ
jgi:hypothetical protein